MLHLICFFLIVLESGVIYDSVLHVPNFSSCGCQSSALDGDGDRHPDDGNRDEEETRHLSYPAKDNRISLIDR